MRKEQEGEWQASTLWRILEPQKSSPVAVVGAGGKSALLAAAAAEARRHGSTLFLSVTTRLALPQTGMADRTVYLAEAPGDAPLKGLAPRGGEVVLLASRLLEEVRKIEGIPPETLASLAAAGSYTPLILEADGAAGADLKVPGPGEPVIPDITSTVVAVTGLPALGADIGKARVHRREMLENLFPGERRLSPSLLAALLAHPDGSFKGAPVAARKIWLINKADGPREMARAKAFAEEVCGELRGSPGKMGPELLMVGSLRSGALAAKELLPYYVHRERKDGAF